MAKETLLDLDVVITPKSLKKLQKQSVSEITKATIRTVETLTERAEQATLIKTYTQNAGPHKPEGSTYIRTFRMQRSSERRIVRSTLPVEGIWEAKISYASRVIGLAKDQAPIHAGRWPILEGVINNINFIAQSVFDKEIAGLK